MRHSLLPIAAALALTAASIVSAFAHASLEKSEASEGGYKAVMRIPHGCDEQATNSVRIEIPEGYASVKPMPKSGWNVEVEKGDYARSYTIHGKEVKSGVTAVTWKGGDLPSDFYDEFVVSGTLAGVKPDAVLLFPTIQTCKDGTVKWTEVAKDGEDPHALEYPAPTLKIVEAVQAGHDHGAAEMKMPMNISTTDTVKVGNLEISSAWARATLPGQPAGGGFVTIKNKGEAADRLLSVSSTISKSTQLHEMKMEGDVMKMAELTEGLLIPAGETVELKPGGNHLMFFDLNEGFKEGSRIAVDLTFETAGNVAVELQVLPANTKEMPHQHGG